MFVRRPLLCHSNKINPEIDKVKTRQRLLIFPGYDDFAIRLFVSEVGGKAREETGGKAAKGVDCLAIFVDGLDEYHGNHQELVAYLQQLQKAPCIKLCVSSRAWNVFADAFQVGSSLAERGGCV